ncbi:PEP/pyruvate-binding domain-containing protein [Spongiactinospora sp. TRM90649]|uniref:PEP/pyruvate-binding domain-containing protein n=1 Tax=Spongiactinospora sp. TRM90649 TaxID=3031114 RepID=UPI0023F8BF11|nr:PEP/pyruvate-binding domain-containing protein [Spongiactinospora sp. TRM90649]MDF5752752.1 PEP/pyruvate-binding domain-containing protein [Spongiactinospora sp. TRM90649]
MEGTASVPPLVTGLADTVADPLGLVGGKAASLGVLLRAGFPVPDGFCVTTEAYRLVAESAGVQGPPGARERLLAAEIPTEVARAVRERLDERPGGGPVAVRSSATAEDLPHASFAGQQDTFLQVEGTEAILAAIRRCWASLWTDRAVAYREAAGIGHDSVRLAVIVQDMVQARVAGVLFTADPLTGRRGMAVIDAASGLGEAVVSGSVNPDHFAVDTATGTVSERRPGAGSGPPCLDDARVRELAALGAKVEPHYGAPQDIEWALDGRGRLWLTQSRPITTLFPIPDGRDGLRVFFCVTVAQGLNRPITPMGLSAMRVLASSVATLFGLPPADPLAGPPVFAEAGHRVFVDATAAVRSRPGRAVVPRALDFMEARSAVVLRGLMDDPRLSVNRRSWRPLLRRAGGLALRRGMPLRTVHYLLRPRHAIRDANRLRARLEARLAPPPAPTADERLDHAVRALGSVFPLFPAVVPGPAAGFTMLGLAGRLLRGRARSDEVQTVLRGLPHNVTTEMDLALWALAVRLRHDPESSAALLGTPPERLAAMRRDGELPEALASGLTAFLGRHGRRAVAEIDLGLPRWSEDPEHVLGVLANYLRLRDRELEPDAVFARGAAEATRMIGELAARAGGVRGGVVRFALSRARALVGLRELPKFLLITALAAAREQIAAVGAELAGRGLLDEPDDVFFVTLAEARSAVRHGTDLREPVARARAGYERELGRRRVPRVLLSDGTDPEAVAVAPPDGALTGSPASAGVATGSARVVLDPVGAHLEPGEILVCPSTDPGWTPLFLTAGGLVMEMGGANSHGAVVAREYGIPAAVGVAHATEVVRTGQRITVDGTSGVVLTKDDMSAQ